MLKKVIFFLIIIPAVIWSLYMGISTHQSKRFKIDYAGLERSYRVHYPKGYVKSKKYPLVVALHAYKDDARIMELYTGFSKKADQEGFIVVYPQAYKNNFLTISSWNANFCCGWAFENKIDDVGFVKEVISRVVGQGSVNESKIYLVGMSNGAMLSNMLALELGDTISAQAIVAGAVGAQYEEDEEFTYLEKSFVPIPTIIIHGKSDKSVPFDGGASDNRVINFTGAYDTLNFWLDNNKCNKHPSTVSKQGGVTFETYEDCENSDISFYAVESSHSWPGSIQDTINIVSKNSVNATDVIWDYLSSY